MGAKTLMISVEKKVLFKIEILKMLMIQRARRSERILKQRLGIIKGQNFFKTGSFWKMTFKITSFVT